MTAHLDDHALEAFAHGRAELTTDAARAHVATCDTCAERVALARAESATVARTFATATPRIDDGELASLVAGALASAGTAQPPSRRAVLVAGGLGTMVLAVSAALSFRTVPTTHGVLGALHDALHVSVTVDRIVRAGLPGGWGTLALACAAIALATAWPLIRLSRGLSLATARGIVVVGSLFALATFGVAARAHAVDFTGEWPPGERVTLTASHARLSQVLSRAAEGAGVGYVGTLADDPEVTVSVRGAPLREFLEALLGDAPLIVDHQPGMLVVRPSQPEAPAAPPDVPSVAPPLPPVPPVPPVPAVPAVPPPPDVDLGDANDRVTFGGDIVVREGERVRSVVTMGGDAEIRGEVLGDVTSMGGDIHVRRGGVVRGQLISMGGEIVVDDGANVPVGGVRAHGRHHGRVHVDDLPEAPRAQSPNVAAHVLAEVGEAASDVTGHLARYALVFLVGLLLLALAPRRFADVTRVLREQPLRALAVGALAAIAGLALFIVLVVSIIGIPGALAVGIAAAIAGYAGLAAVASVLGTALPLSPLARKPIAQLGAGAGVLFVVSLVPFFGALALFAAVLAGAGAVVLTQTRRREGPGTETKNGTEN